jgi:hypothetical protein
VKESRGTVRIAASVVFLALLVVAGPWWHHERGAWLRVEPGKATLCVLIEGRQVTDGDLREFDEGRGILESFMTSIHEVKPLTTFAWTLAASQPSTLFRWAYQQYILSPDFDIAPALIWTDWVPPFRASLPLHLPGFRFRLALVDSRGDVVARDP